MSYGSSYDANRHLGHSTARARADAEAAVRKAEERKAEERRRQRGLEAQAAGAHAASSRTPLNQAPSPSASEPSGPPRVGRPLPPPSPRLISYPTPQTYPGGRHPGIYALDTYVRTHPQSGDPVLEIMWHDTLPRQREFVPLSALRSEWRGVESQGVVLPMQVRREGGNILVRWLSPATTAVSASARRPDPDGMKVMIGLDGADKRPTFRLLPTSGDNTGTRESLTDLLAKAAGAAVVSGGAAVFAWYRNRRQSSRDSG